MIQTPKEKKLEKLASHYIDIMVKTLKDIYSNKSSDEYKSRGNITLSPVYHNIEKSLAGLSSLQGYSKTDGAILKNLFNALHRPIYSKLVTEYLEKPNDRNTIFTAVYTVGYRLLVGELSRIYASTVATENGIKYKPDKISRKENLNKFIRLYNADLERRLDEYIKQEYSDTPMIQEAAVGTVVSKVLNIIPATFEVLGRVFNSAKELNPVALMDAVLMRSFDKKVAKYQYISSMYEATQNAYNEYMKLPDAQRKKKIESKYIKDMEKYNIKMQNLKAEIEHYDSRAEEEMKDALKASTTKSSTSKSTKTTSSDKSTSSDDEFDF